VSGVFQYNATALPLSEPEVGLAFFGAVGKWALANALLVYDAERLGSASERRPSLPAA